MIENKSQVMIEMEKQISFQERRSSPLTRVKFDLLAEKAKLEVSLKLNVRTFAGEWIIEGKILAIDQTIELINEQLKLGHA